MGLEGRFYEPLPLSKPSLQVLIALTRDSAGLEMSRLQTIGPLRPSSQSTDFIVGL